MADAIPPVIAQPRWNVGRIGMILSFAAPLAIAMMVLLQPG